MRGGEEATRLQARVAVVEHLVAGAEVVAQLSEGVDVPIVGEHSSELLAATLERHISLLGSSDKHFMYASIESCIGPVVSST